MKDAVVRARVHADLKIETEKIFDTLGIDTAQAIRMFLTQVKLRKGLPFHLDIPEDDDLLVSRSLRQKALDSVYDD